MGGVAETAVGIVKIHRIWIEIVILSTTIAFGLALLIASLGAVAGTAVGTLGPSSFRSVLNAGVA
jgi:hypothetical protein